jgi:PIN domain nuclease of toxin-antitoxin system
MKALMDTYTFLWWNIENPLLSLRAKEIIADGSNEIYLSAASVREITVNTSKGRLVLPESPARYIFSRMSIYRFLPFSIQISHAAQVFKLPPYHSDPFDRLSIAQCQVESLPLIISDENIRQYALETI